MFFTNIITAIYIFSAIEAVVIPDRNVISPRAVSPMVPLRPRALPPCEARELSGPRPTDEVVKDYIDLDELSYKDPEWRPLVCGLVGVNCVRRPAEEIVTLQPTLARIRHNFTLNDGSIIHVIYNGQSTVQWTAPGGTVNSYMAHGTDYICVKGTMSVKFWADGSVFSAGDEPIACMCGYPADGDKTILVETKYSVTQ